jgi:putative aldouronate transport system substrate-binding protein
MKGLILLNGSISTIQKRGVERIQDCSPIPVDILHDVELNNTVMERYEWAVIIDGLPDAFMGTGPSTADHIAWGATGTLIDLTPYLGTYTPNLKGIMAELPIVKNIITATDGKIYSLPYVNLTPHDMPAAREWINVKWLENVGMKEPETLDDLYNVLVAFRDKDPDQNGKNDTIPMSGYVSGLTMQGTFCIITALGYANFGINLQDGKIVYFPAQPEFKEYVTFMKKLYDEKLLDQEYFTHNNAQFTAKFKDYKVAVSQNAAPHGALPLELSHNYRTIKPMTSKFNSTRMWPFNTNIRPTGASLTSGNKYPEATIRWFDHLYSEEGTMLYWYDPVVGERPKDAEYGYKWSDDRSSYDVLIPEKYGTDGWKWRNMDIAPSTNGLPTNIPIKEYYEKIVNEKNQYFLNGLWGLKEYAQYLLPPMYMTEEEQEFLSVKTNDLETYVIEMRAKFILGAEPIENFDKYVNDLKKLGVDDLVSTQQKIYDRSK